MVIRVLLVLTLAGCTGVVPGSVDPIPPTAPEETTGLQARRPRKVPIAPPAFAFDRGWMPLEATGVAQFHSRYPTYDGRGVLIAILDSGIDPSVPGLDDPDRLVDLRDFSEEGHVALESLQVRGDSAVIAGTTLRGMGRLRALSLADGWFGGVVEEARLGRPPASDLNGNGEANDRLPIVVARGSDGWFLLADLDGDGSIANDTPVRDFAWRRESFGWGGAEGPPVTVALNLTSTADGPPHLDLFFDTSGHGTHVAGIAAGKNLYQVEGFHGVAPGADLLGLKIADNGSGGITTTGSMLEAMTYAINVAERRRQPLVVNLSFGVGNATEGTARIDHLVDSVLAAHANVYMTVSAGNDGPGLSTIGFPGSARRIITVGATYPTVFLPRSPGAQPLTDPVAFFSARGGEVAGPTVVAPGMAYSSVPPWQVGDEEKSGTSMAAPQIAGLVARLLSGLNQEGRSLPSAFVMRHALEVTARPIPGESAIDQGAGQPQAEPALAWLREHPVVERITVEGSSHGVDGALVSVGDLELQPVEFVLSNEGKHRPAQLRSSVPWIQVPGSIVVGSRTKVTVRVDPRALPPGPGIWTGVVRGWGESPEEGPLFRLVITAVRSAAVASESTWRGAIGEGGTWRVPFEADSSRPFLLEVRTNRPEQNVLAFLHEPGGQPYRVEHGVPVGAGMQGVMVSVDGRDAVKGRYEMVLVAPPGARAEAGVRIRHSPLRVSAIRGRGGLDVVASNLTTDSVAALLSTTIVGEERQVIASGRGGTPFGVSFTVPPWAERLVVEARFDPEIWTRTTDIGLTLLDSEGLTVETSPMNYPTDRIGMALSGDAQQYQLVVAPGFADPQSHAFWSAAVTIRLYAETRQRGIGESTVLALKADERRPIEIPLPTIPWELDAGFYPLGRVTVASGADTWTIEIPLPPPLQPAQP